MTLVKKLTKQGNSNALILDKGIMELVGIKPDSWVSVCTTDGKSLTIAPVTDGEVVEREDSVHMAKVQDAIDKTHKRFDKVLRKLAD